MDIANNISEIKNTLPEGVKLVAVSKTKPVEDIMVAYRSGHKIFGENKVQDLVGKYEQLPKDIEWHFIGHLQSNKVKFVAPFISFLHGIDSMKLLKVVNKEAKKNDRVISCLLQFHIAEESTKFGFSIKEAYDLLSSEEINSLQNVEIAGVMGMATYTDNESQIRKEFRGLKNIFNTLKNEYFSGVESFREISMGMSDDYLIAVDEGSTIIRVGSKIFGTRNY
ncbi:MAG: YggS family pyridoxal phosphate-dependent enzyme [Prolixibacteraceae bacterium]|jgi:PLP dependent protein|nr:YggS family pyridoxal phosphate-dependent enzyme [Prolixibacteraceae bacterium]MBT6006463.1 YggS family pyridoxal phosphate-dependent enzyme [Prolixibacteraceae bacterium]MBT6765042.1 YggS family pyridoxal phosphate-dependent enzyme [Prolixibacteraceae bacterium]MBT7000159.1 YggS family pyridoxal phosphate-dependent enzyme [Prolixibacteraceae bacterium]MBT7395649.1 YggS family pyridoxal phosphate-dependent enzyme [Prolixibacteraceae bacterium]